MTIVEHRLISTNDYCVQITANNNNFFTIYTRFIKFKHDRLFYSNNRIFNSPFLISLFKSFRARNAIFKP